MHISEEKTKANFAVILKRKMAIKRTSEENGDVSRAFPQCGRWLQKGGQ
jgi:hypothetical protein